MTKGHSIEGALDAVLTRIGAIPFLVLVALVMLLPGFFTLPPMDRDEPRFAQASKQMLETSDFVAIRFGDEARNKKPVGIHWLQAAAVGTAELLHVPDARQHIWIYRVPSLLGAILAVLLTYWAALPLVEPRSAVLAAVLLAATPLLGVEARLATTDAVLAATVTAAMGALVRVYLADEAMRRRLFGNAIVFWAALGIGILIKGPINPLIPSLAAIVLSLRQRSARWLRALRPLPGLVLCLLIVLPWFVLILLKTHGTFFTDAVGHDFLGKVAGGQEMHGAPPGFYLATFWLTAWPFAPFVILAAPGLWRDWRDPKIAVPPRVVCPVLAHPRRRRDETRPLCPAALSGAGHPGRPRDRARRMGRPHRFARRAAGRCFSSWDLFRRSSSRWSSPGRIGSGFSTRWRSASRSSPWRPRSGPPGGRVRSCSSSAPGRHAPRRPRRGAALPVRLRLAAAPRASRRASPYRRASSCKPKRRSAPPVLIRAMRRSAAGNPA